MQNLNKNWPCGFKNGLRSCVNFHQRTQKPEKLYNDGLDLWPEKSIRHLVNFHANKRKSKNMLFDGLLLSKTYKILIKKVHKSYVSWQWRAMQSLKKNRLFIPKMKEGMWWILMWAVVKYENLHFDGLLLSINVI